METPNMKKEWLRELRQLTAAEKNIARQKTRLLRGIEKEVAVIHKRRLVLAGRLS